MGLVKIGTNLGRIIFHHLSQQPRNSFSNKNALFWAWWFLGDKPKLEQVTGAIVMILGAVLVKW